MRSALRKTPATLWNPCGQWCCPRTSSQFPGLRLGSGARSQRRKPHQRNPNVVVLSYELWERRFEGDREVLGRSSTSTAGRLR